MVISFWKTLSSIPLFYFPSCYLYSKVSFLCPQDNLIWSQLLQSVLNGQTHDTLRQVQSLCVILSAWDSVRAKMKESKIQFLHTGCVDYSHPHESCLDASRGAGAQQHTAQRKYTECRQAVIWPVSSWPWVTNTSKYSSKSCLERNGKWEISFTMGNCIVRHQRVRLKR